MSNSAGIRADRRAPGAPKRQECAPSFASMWRSPRRMPRPLPYRGYPSARFGRVRDPPSENPSIRGRPLQVVELLVNFTAMAIIEKDGREAACTGAGRFHPLTMEKELA